MRTRTSISRRNLGSLWSVIRSIPILTLVILLGGSAAASPIFSIGPAIQCIDSGSTPGIAANSVVQKSIVVPANAGCTLTNDVITGNVTVQNGASYLNAVGTHIKGNLIDLGASEINLGTLQGTIFPGADNTCPPNYTFNSNNGLCEYNNLNSAGSNTTIAGNLQAVGGGDISLDGVNISGNLQTFGVNSITTTPPVSCVTNGIAVTIFQVAVVVANGVGVFSVQALVCNNGVLQIIANDNGFLDFLPGRPVNVGGSLQIVNTTGVPPNSTTNAICNTQVGRNFALNQNQAGAPFTVGSAFMDSPTLGGLLFSPCIPNTISGNSQINLNAGAITGNGNVFLGDLLCVGNTPAPSGSGNVVAGRRLGQCSNGSTGF